MIRVLLDNDVAGFQTLLTGTVEKAGWGGYELIEFITLESVGLGRATSDREIWRHCQPNGLILLTANRNQRGEDSLQLTIREENAPGSLPVFTVRDQQRLHNAAYREACVESLLTIIVDLPTHLDTGRLYIP